MSKEEMIQEIIEISAHNMDWFIGFVGLLLAFFAYFQWRLSQAQLENLKKEIKREIADEYSLYKIANIKNINTNLTNLVLANLKGITNELISKAGMYSDNLITEKSIEVISYLDILKNREIDSADFIRNIEHMFRMIDTWSSISSNNLINEDTKMYLYRIFSDLSRKENWQKVKGYDEAIVELKVRVKALNTFKYIDLEER
ncbi:hypothetical protein GIX81_09250 [Lactobacillus reuteri]|uniref:Uncharacterized protein n=1 Tax=Limosilactobacillus reuteri TaxID=1598 RepID=A0A6L5P7S6_LIMRT|nr:hypothetical protein [Limosilactobacillus reuteri]MRH09627.1 hypothetical protein [Limosilactobacillus reuteri]